uniref:Basic tail secreted protein n=1 Tax=Rhipicephalus zambeziensis TaxID=60191 RepID=A0A224YCG1_9ACAR
MNAFYLLCAFVPLAVADVGTNYTLCPNRTYDAKKDNYRQRCVYYCSNGPGWFMAYLLNGTKCWFTENANGTCYNGMCYLTLPDGVTLGSLPVSSEVTMSTAAGTEGNGDTESPPGTEPSVPDDTRTTHKGEKKKKKESEKKSKKEKKKKKKEKGEKKKKKKEEVEGKQKKDKDKKKKKEKKGKQSKLQEW